VTSDHGEAFGEHGYWEHGQSLHTEETRVPLVALVPGGRPAAFATPVSVTDLYATILDLLETGATEPPPSSLSLARAMKEGVEPEAHPVISEILGREGSVHPLTMEAVTLGQARLVHNITRGDTMLFDLAKDPDEIHPVVNPQLGRILESYLAPLWWEEQEAVAAQKMRLSDEDLARLRSLGYVR